jgi:hypothetical protein
MATPAAVAEGAHGQAHVTTRPYSASWLDAIVNWIEHLPGPTWLAYVVLTGLAFGFVALEASISSRGLLGQEPLYFGYAFFHVYPLAAYHFLSRGALRSWDRFRPATDLDDEAAARLRVELSTTPARPAVAVWFATAAVVIGLELALAEGWDLTGHSLPFVALRMASEGLWMFPVATMLAYFLLRQLRIVSMLHRHVKRVDLLQPGPLHAMSTLTARSALVLLAFQVLVFVPLPNMSETVRLTAQLATAPFLALSVISFFLPLRGMHDLLAAEKDRRKAEISQRIDATTAAFHAVVDDATGSCETRDPESTRLAQVRIDALGKALTSLLQQREFIGKLSTWPWGSSTLRGVLSAFAVPIILFVLTRALERIVF